MAPNKVACPNAVSFKLQVEIYDVNMLFLKVSLLARRVVGV